MIPRKRGLTKRTLRRGSIPMVVLHGSPMVALAKPSAVEDDLEDHILVFSSQNFEGVTGIGSGGDLTDGLFMTKSGKC
jgi:hypothetical protein